MIKPTWHTRKHKEVTHAWRERESERKEKKYTDSTSCKWSIWLYEILSLKKNASHCNLISPAVMQMDCIVIARMQSNRNMAIISALCVVCYLSPLLFTWSTIRSLPLYCVCLSVCVRLCVNMLESIKTLFTLSTGFSHPAEAVFACSFMSMASSKWKYENITAIRFAARRKESESEGEWGIRCVIRNKLAHILWQTFKRIYGKCICTNSKVCDFSRMMCDVISVDIST